MELGHARSATARHPQIPRRVPQQALQHPLLLRIGSPPADDRFHTTEVTAAAGARVTVLNFGTPGSRRATSAFKALRRLEGSAPAQRQ